MQHNRRKVYRRRLSLTKRSSGISDGLLVKPPVGSSDGVFRIIYEDDGKPDLSFRVPNFQIAVAQSSLASG